MLVVPRTHPGQLQRDTRAVGHEPGRLQDWAKLGPFPAHSRCHPELAHVRQHSGHVLAIHQLGNAVEAPAGREVGVLVEDVAPVVPLELVHLAAEIDIALRLLHSLLELEYPQLEVLVHKLI